MSANSDNIEAINEFMHRTAPATPAAAIAFNDWVQWYEATKPSFLSFWSDADFDHARNLRNAFNRANAVTSAQKQRVDEVIKGGVSSEQAQGLPDRRNASGDIVELPPGVVHQWWFWPAIAAGATAGALLLGPTVIKLYAGGKS